MTATDPRWAQLAVLALELSQTTYQLPPRFSVMCCQCGEHHGPRDWITLEYVGVQREPGSFQPTTEIRTCVCGAPVAVGVLIK